MDYYERTEMSCSKLKDISNGFENANKKKQTTPAMTYGTIFHEFVLENIKSFVIEPEEMMKRIKSRNCKEYQAWKKEQSKHVLSYFDMLSLVKMQKSIFKKERFFNLYNSKDKEVEKESFREFQGIPFKSKADIVNLKKGIGADLKTIDEIKKGSIERAIYDMKYHWQDYIYRKMFDLKEFFFVFVEKKDPYKAQIIELDADWIKIAKYEVTKVIDDWKDYQTGFVGEGLKDEKITVPTWISYKYKDLL